jgi:hypothetical protein
MYFHHMAVPSERGNLRTGIFVNYRVGDCEREAALLARILVERFGGDQVFFASRSIHPGDNFTEAIPDGLARSSVLLAVIGANWLTVTDGSGRPRIELADDWVRREIRIAMKDGLRVIPILVDGATRLRMPDKTRLPPDIQGLTDNQYVRMHYQNTNVDLLIERLSDSNPELFLRGLLTTAVHLPDRFAPSMLLKAEYGIVPFRGREREEQDFDEWCTADLPVAARLITGPGGQGKTRFAKQLCEKRSQDGWLAGIVEETADPAALSAATSVQAPVLLVFDYAESRADQLRAVARQLLREERNGHPARLLLLSRAAGEWLANLSIDADDRVVMIFQAATEQRLAPLAATAETRQAEFTRATLEFAARLHFQVDVNPPSDLPDSRYERALDVHAAALAALLDAEHPSQSAATGADPVWRVLEHERRYWARSLGEYGLPTDRSAQVEALVAAATLFGAPSEQSALRLLRTLDAFGGTSVTELRAYLRWASDLYPGIASLNALRPDRLGEDHVARTLERQPNLAAEGLPSVSELQLSRALTVLGRAASRHSSARDRIGELLVQDATRLLPLGMEVATQLDNPRPLAAALTETLRDHHDPEIIRRVLECLPDQTSALADLAVLATDLTLESAERRAQINPKITAYLLMRHAQHLRQVARHSEALQAAQRADDLLAGLAASDRTAYLPDLGRCAHTLAVLHSDLGQSAQGLETIIRAVELRRELVSADEGAYLPELALSLDVLSSDQAEFGHWESGLLSRQESVAAFRRLVELHQERYEPNLATALGNMSSLFKQLRRLAESEAAAAEAVRISRRLADSYPDKYLPSLALSLDHHAGVLSDLHSPQEALDLICEAVSIGRKLSADGAESAIPELTSALINQSIIQSQCGLPAESLASAAEAVDLYRRLALDNTDRFSPRLAMALTSYANRLGEQGRSDDALVAIDEVIAIRRHLAESRPAAERPQLALAHANKGVYLMRQRRWEDSAIASSEAIEIYRELRPDQPEMVTPALAGTLHNLAAAMQNLGDRNPEAGARIDEAVTLRRALYAQYPAVHARALADSLTLAARIRSQDSSGLAQVAILLQETMRLAREINDERLVMRTQSVINELVS